MAFGYIAYAVAVLMGLDIVSSPSSFTPYFTLPPPALLPDSFPTSSIFSSSLSHLSQDSAPLHCFSLAGCSIQPEYPQVNANRHILNFIHTDKEKCEKCKSIPKPHFSTIPMSLGTLCPVSLARVFSSHVTSNTRSTKL